jgi:anaphase-promoting complex subunit 10
VRFYVDYNEDESYTPTKIVFRSGTSENNLIDFAVMELQTPVGWQQVPIAGAGGGPDGNTLFSYVFQMQILENHQNGKDTHLRGIKIFASDGDAAAAGPEPNPVDEVADLLDRLARAGGSEDRGGRSVERKRFDESGFTIPDFMKEPEIR